jgi:hypothetical protein
VEDAPFAAAFIPAITVAVTFAFVFDFTFSIKKPMLWAKLKVTASEHSTQE